MKTNTERTEITVPLSLECKEKIARRARRRRRMGRTRSSGGPAVRVFGL